MSFSWPLLLVAAALQQGAATKSAAPARSAATGATTAFVNVSVIPMDREQVLAGQTVVVRGGTIVDVGPTATVKVPAGATRIDGQGKFLMPGLGDMHVHFFSNEDNGQFGDWYMKPRLFCYVANGVTSIRVMENDTMLVETRRKVLKGEVLGPAMHLVAGISSFRDTMSKFIPAIKAAGYGFISMGNQFQERMLDSILPLMRENGIRMTGELPRTIGVEGAFKIPYASIEQLQGYIEYLGSVTDNRFANIRTPMGWDSVLSISDGPRVDESKIATIAAQTKQAGVWNTPMQAQAEQMIDLWSGKGASTKSTVVALRRKIVKGLHDAGAGLLLGSDAPTWGADYGTAAHQELETLVALGLTPYQALETGTKNVATFLGNADSAGTIAAGKRADLVLLSGNPLQDIKATTKLAGVMVDGRWLSKAKIDAELKPDDCVGR